MKRILHFKNITFKSSFNWFKTDIHQQQQPLTANYLAMSKIISTTIYTWYKAQTKCKTRFQSQGMILNVFFFLKKSLETPPTPPSWRYYKRKTLFYNSDRNLTRPRPMHHSSALFLSTILHHSPSLPSAQQYCIYMPPASSWMHLMMPVFISTAGALVVITTHER